MVSRPPSKTRRQPDDLLDSVSEFDSPTAPKKNRVTTPIRGAKLSPIEFLRFSWRLLTSMRTAIVLLVLLAVAAIPGSIVPQRSSDPNGVSALYSADPELAALYDRFQLFDTFTSVWFSSIYLLLFVSLIGCIVPRIIHHWGVLRAAPAEAPSSWGRLAERRLEPAAGGVAAALDRAEGALRARRYRVLRDGDSIAAEFGYLRETGNLVFHIALVGILATLALAGGFGWNGQRVLVEGQTFTNQLSSYDTFHPGAWFAESNLDAYGLTLNDFTPEYVRDEAKGTWMPVDFTARLTVTDDTGARDVTLKVNDPLAVGGSQVYLLGNGYAPVITITNGEGRVVFDQPVVFLSQDSNLTSVGVVKIPDGITDGLGMQGFFYPSAVTLDSGALASDNPEPTNPTVTFNVYTGDLGLDSGSRANAFQLPIDQMTQVAGRHTGIDVVLTPGDSVALPDGLGTVTFSGLDRFIGIEIRHDATQLGVAISAFFLVAGLLATLSTRRRRVWIRVAGTGRQRQLEWGAMSRGDDPRLEVTMDALVKSARQGPGDRVSPV